LSITALALLLFAVGFVVMLVGVLLIMLSALREAGKRSEGGEVEAGGVLIVGPVPIVVGSSQRIAKILLVLAIALTLLVLLVYLITSGLLRVAWS
jgi:uncharacterized protein (TIGR00304 family)